MKPEVAEMVMQSKAFRFHSPFHFNDPFDSQFDVLSLGMPLPEIRKKMLNNLFEQIKRGESGAHPLLEDTGLIQYKPLLQLLFQSKETEQRMMEKLSSWMADTAQFSEQIKNLFAKAIQNIFICCFSETKDSLTMWSHYARDHKGVVLGFDSEHKLFAGVEKVEYVKNFPKIGTEEDWQSIINGGEIRGMIKPVIRCKALDWAYEEEWRLIINDHNFAGKEFIDVEFDPRSIKEVYFGCKIDPMDKEAILSLKDGRYQHVNFYQAQKSKNKFELKFAKL